MPWRQFDNASCRLQVSFFCPFDDLFWPWPDTRVWTASRLAMPPMDD
jgi:hypothetical protein